MERYEEGLRRRTEAVTWMVWGLVLAGLAVSYAAVEAAATPVAEEGTPRPWTLLFPWSPWMLAGGLVTYALWRSAALHSPGLRRAWWVGVLALLGVGIGMWIVFIASWFLPPVAQQAYSPTTLMGLASLGVVLSPLARLTPLGRRVGAATALVQVACGVALGFLLPMDGPVELATAAIVGTTWLAAGLWQSSQG